MKFRGVVVGALAAVGSLMLVATTAWACTSTSGPFISDVVPDRSPVGTTVLLKGGGWESSSTVNLGWMAREEGVLAPFTTVTTGTEGSFELQAPVPEGSAGMFFIVATQGAVERRMPFELSAGAAAARDAAAVAGDTGLGALEQRDRTTGTTSGSGAPLLPLALVAGVGLLAIAGVGTATAGRRRARVRAAASDEG
jgi:hypothetical protein